MPLNVKKYSKNDFKEQTWKIGAGKTLELALDSEEPYRWRLSRAALKSSGPFSTFPDYERVLMTLGNSTIWILHGGGRKRILPSFTPYTFSGNLETIAEITEPMDDFNLFCLKGKAEGKIYPTYFRVSKDMQLPVAGEEHFIYSVNGTITVYDQNSNSENRISTGELLQISKTDQKEYLNLKAVGPEVDTIALWIVVHLFK